MRIVIVGGGMAGWLTASYLKKNIPALNITLIEDPKISKTLVGESIAPTVTDFILDLGIDETDFIRETNASYKLGSRFNNFSNLKRDSDYVSVNINFDQSKLLSNSPVTLRDFITEPNSIKASDLLLELIKQKELTDFIKYWNPQYSYMKKNKGNLDRIIRIVIALAIEILCFSNIITGVLGIVLLIGAFVFLFTSIVSFCPLYNLIGLNTYESKKKE
jgi:hypothetical protein